MNWNRNMKSDGGESCKVNFFIALENILESETNEISFNLKSFFQKMIF